MFGISHVRVTRKGAGYTVTLYQHVARGRRALLQVIEFESRAALRSGNLGAIVSGLQEESGQSKASDT